MNTLIDKIQEALLSDDDDREEQSEYLTEAYKEASQESKEAIDRCFIALSGFQPNKEEGVSRLQEHGVIN